MDLYLPAFMRLLPFKRSVFLLLVHVAHTQNHDRSAITVCRTGIPGLHTIFGACPVRLGGGANLVVHPQKNKQETTKIRSRTFFGMSQDSWKQTSTWSLKLPKSSKPVMEYFSRN